MYICSINVNKQHLQVSKLLSFSSVIGVQFQNRLWMLWKKCLKEWMLLDVLHHEANSVIGVNFLSRACITSRVQFSPFHKHTYEYITVAIVDSRCLSNRRNQLINMFFEIFSYQIKFTRECCVRCEWEAETADHSTLTNEKEEKWQISTEKYSHSLTRVVVKLEI